MLEKHGDSHLHLTNVVGGNDSCVWLASLASGYTSMTMWHQII